MASTELKRTISSAGSQTKWGASAWVKRCDLGLSAAVYCSSKSDTTKNLRGIFWTDTDQLQVAFYDGSYSFEVKTNRKFRDTNAWYHIVVNLDTSQSTNTDRIKIWVNGVQETSMATSSYPSQNATFNFLGTDITQLVGSLREGSSIHHSCVISHLYFTDGYCYPASTFGSTDSTTGEWKINTSPTIANYGTNGFFILKDGNSVTDQSGQGNNLTVSGGTLTKTEDNPSNVFATLNPLSNDKTSGITMLNGNNTLTTPSGGHDFSITTLGMNSGSGKFYCEVKVSSSANFNMIGISDHSYQGSNQELSEDNYSYGYYSDSGGGSTAGVVRGNGSNVLTGMPNYTTNDIIGIAIDLENHKLYFHKNGTYINSGSPTSGSTGTGAVSIQDLRTVTSNYGNAAYFFGVSDWTTSSGGTYQCNFGNGYFGTTAVSSAGTNASNLGIFEYDVPSGYTALCTKGLNE